MTQTITEMASPTLRFVKLQPNQFRQHIDQMWSAVEQILDTISQQVEDQKITPLEGASLAACTAATVYGYEELHQGRQQFIQPTRS